MEVDFKPDFEGSDVTLLAYALLPGGTDAPFPGMDDNACHWMNCPVVKDTTQTYTFNLTMSKDYPSVSFKSKSRLIPIVDCFVFLGIVQRSLAHEAFRRTKMLFPEQIQDCLKTKFHIDAEFKEVFH
jgi:hypothetical protein